MAIVNLRTSHAVSPTEVTRETKLNISGSGILYGVSTSVAGFKLTIDGVEITNGGTGTADYRGLIPVHVRFDASLLVQSRAASWVCVIYTLD